MAPLVGFGSGLSVFAGLTLAEPGLLLFGIVMGLPLLWPTLLGATLHNGVLEYGPRWRRECMAVADIAEVQVGKVRRFGYRGGHASGLLVVSLDGTSRIVTESRYCGVARLRRWAELISRCNTSVITREPGGLIDDPRGP